MGDVVQPQALACLVQPLGRLDRTFLVCGGRRPSCALRWGSGTDDPRMAALVGELSVKSDRFRRLWARQDVVRPADGPARMNHPEVGDLELHREKLIVAGADGQVLVIYHADPGTPSAQALDLLAAIAAGSATVTGLDVRSGR